MRGLSLVVASGGHSSSRCAGLSLSRPLLLRSTGSRRAGSVIVAHGPRCSAACGIFPDQGSNPCPPHWQADSQPLRHQGSPPSFLRLNNIPVCSSGPLWGLTRLSKFVEVTGVCRAPNPRQDLWELPRCEGLDLSHSCIILCLDLPHSSLHLCLLSPQGRPGVLSQVIVKGLAG